TLTNSTWTASVYLLAVMTLAVAASGKATAQSFEANYDESKVPAYDLPPILDEETKSATDFATAWQKRREQLLATFAEQMYGKQPQGGYRVRCEKFESGPSLGGKALRQQFHVVITTDAGEHTLDFLVFTPASVQGPVPCFLGLSFYGNHTV